jgi:hypothetical protein
MDHLHGANAKAFLEESIDDESGIAGFDGIGLEYRKRSLHGIPFGF